MQYAYNTDVTRKNITFPEQRTLAGHAPFIVVGINACYVLFFGVGIGYPSLLKS